MKPPPFRHLAPRSVEEATDMLAEHADSVRVLAGGQSLMPLLVMRMARPAVLVDLNRCPGLSGIAAEGGVLRLGAMARHIAVQRSPEVARAAPLLAEALQWAGPRAVRNRGTIGGTIAHADPSAEACCVALCLDADIVLARRGGMRQVATRDFLLDALVTAAEPDEMVVELRIPVPPAGTRTRFLEVGVRQADLAMAAIALALRAGPDGTVQEIRVAAIGAASRAVRLGALEEMLKGTRPTPASVREAVRAALARCEPPADLIAGAEHRRAVLEGLAERAILETTMPERSAA
jgi:carbon-monoxide dehydrogenase medium subunit